MVKTDSQIIQTNFSKSLVLYVFKASNGHPGYKMMDVMIKDTQAYKVHYKGVQLYLLTM